jgi:hypothetical protein
VVLFDKIVSNTRAIWGRGEKFGLQGPGLLQINNTRELFAIRQERVCCHCLRCGGRVGVRWPIYRATLLVSVVLIQPIPIICDVGSIKTTDTKDNHLQSWSH